MLYYFNNKHCYQDYYNVKRISYIYIYIYECALKLHSVLIWNHQIKLVNESLKIVTRWTKLYTSTSTGSIHIVSGLYETIGCVTHLTKLPRQYEAYIMEVATKWRWLVVHNFPTHKQYEILHTTVTNSIGSFIYVGIKPRYEFNEVPILYYMNMCK